MKILALSDTHNQHRQLTLPECDLLVHSGDATEGRLHELNEFLAWFGDQPSYYKIFVPGNHDRQAFRSNMPWLRQTCSTNGVRVLINEQIILPHFNVSIAGVALLSPQEYLDVPETEILVTHEPPYQILDRTSQSPRPWQSDDPHQGHKNLLNLKPKVHIFGHIHEGYGQTKIGQTQYINASLCDLEGKIINKPIEVIYD